MALLSANCLPIAFAFAPIARHSPAARSTLLPPPNLHLHSCKFAPPSLRFASPFFVDSTLLRIGTGIANVPRSTGTGGATASSCSIVVSPETLRWVFTASAAILMLLRNTAINKAFLVPLLALQAPQNVITWLRGEYGMWAAFLALIVRLFYYIPGELELPLMFVLLVITSPYQAMDFRGTAAATILCAGMAAYLAYQHFSKAGGIKGSFQEGTFLATLAIICLVSVPFIFFFQGF